MDGCRVNVVSTHARTNTRYDVLLLLSTSFARRPFSLQFSKRERESRCISVAVCAHTIIMYKQEFADERRQLAIGKSHQCD